VHSGNSTKATSGINGAGTEAQQEANIKDSIKLFFVCSSQASWSHLRPET
jgi:hypothetical protein